MQTIATTTYQNWNSVILESAFVRVQLIPELGAKIVTLQNKQTGKEWLVDAGRRQLMSRPYGYSFGDADMSGWDECFPTIDPCVALGYGEGVLPDHGEVWSLPWEVDLFDHSICCQVKGMARPYVFKRTISFVDDHTLRLDYEVRNTGSDAMSFLWVPHPQFIVNEPTRIMLPSNVEELRCVYGAKEHSAGISYDWKELSIIDERQSGDGSKFYYEGIQHEGWCGLIGEHSGDYLKMEYDSSKTPYFGLWIDRGIGNDRNVITLEPSIGYYDRLDRAIANGTAQAVLPNQSWQWSLLLRLGSKGNEQAF